MSEPYSQLAEGQRPWEERENEKRSGGPMAAMVDKVMQDFSAIPSKWLWCDHDALAAAIRRAADTSAKEIWDNLKVSKDAVTCCHHKAMMETFERHIRQELGL